MPSCSIGIQQHEELVRTLPEIDSVRGEVDVLAEPSGEPIESPSSSPLSHGEHRRGCCFSLLFVGCSDERLQDFGRNTVHRRVAK